MTYEESLEKARRKYIEEMAVILKDRKPDPKMFYLGGMYHILQDRFTGRIFAGSKMPLFSSMPPERMPKRIGEVVLLMTGSEFHDTPGADRLKIALRVWELQQQDKEREENENLHIRENQRA
jgi:hypothetical protein